MRSGGWLLFFTMPYHLKIDSSTILKHSIAGANSFLGENKLKRWGDRLLDLVRDEDNSTGHLKFTLADVQFIASKNTGYVSKVHVSIIEDVPRQPEVELVTNLKRVRTDTSPQIHVPSVGKVHLYEPLEKSRDFCGLESTIGPLGFDLCYKFDTAECVVYALSFISRMQWFWRASFDCQHLLKNCNCPGLLINSHSTKIAGIEVSLSTWKFASLTPLFLWSLNVSTKLSCTLLASMRPCVDPEKIHVSIPSALLLANELQWILTKI